MTLKPVTGKPFDFEQKRQESSALVERVRLWFASQGDIAAVIDVQNDPDCYYRGDLLIRRKNGTEQYVEVKCESSYRWDKTPNMAVERYSNIERGTMGGPWRTSALYYAHIYREGRMVIVNRAMLIEWLDKALAADPNAFEYKRIPNDGYTTGTYLVPRERVKTALGAWYREYQT